MPKKRRVVKDKPIPKIVIESEEEDDWMKALPGYEDEVKLHEELEEKLKREQ